MAITKEQIFQVADELDQADQNPTLANVRKVLGGGSYTTISEAMSEWRARRAVVQAPLRDPAPQVVADRLADLGGEIWAVSLELANARLASEREALEAVRVEMEGARQEAVDLADELAAELDEARIRIVALDEQFSTAKMEIVALRDTLASSSERAATAEVRAKEIERRADDLRAELDRMHHAMDHARAELHKAQEDAVKSEAMVKAARDEAELIRAATQQERDRLVNELATVKAHLAAEREQYQEMRKHVAQESARQAERFTTVQSERDEARKVARKASEEAAVLRGRIEGLEIAISRSK